MLRQTEQQLRAALRSPKQQLVSWWRYILPALHRWNQQDGADGSARGWHTNLALYRSFVTASRYTPWTLWSLHPLACLLLADLLAAQQIKRIVEFGAGYSTIFLAKFMQQVSLCATIDSFEHQKEFSSRLVAASHRIGQEVTLHSCDLIQCTDEQFHQLFQSNIDASLLLKQHTTRVPISEYRNTRLRNSFYDYDFSNFPDRSIDLMILDGPNSNGRSMAFPLLKHKMRQPGWLLIDDYLDYPYLADLQRVFQAEIVAKQEIDENEFVLLKLHGLQ